VELAIFAEKPVAELYLTTEHIFEILWGQLPGCPPLVSGTAR